MTRQQTPGITSTRRGVRYAQTLCAFPRGRSELSILWLSFVHRGDRRRKCHERWIPCQENVPDRGVCPLHRAKRPTECAEARATGLSFTACPLGMNVASGNQPKLLGQAGPVRRQGAADQHERRSVARQRTVRRGRYKPRDPGILRNVVCLSLSKVDLLAPPSRGPDRTHPRHPVPLPRVSRREAVPWVDLARAIAPLDSCLQRNATLIRETSPCWDVWGQVTGATGHRSDSPCRSKLLR